MSDTALLNLSIGTKKALSNLNKFNNEVNKAGKTVALKLSAPLLALETIAIKTFAEMESGLTDITNLLDKGEGFEAYETKLGDVQEQAIELGFSIDDVNKSLFDNVSALGMGEQALEAYEEAQVLAIGGNATISDAVKGTSRILNAYGRDITNAKDVTNAFFLAQKAGATTVSELAVNIGKVAPAAASAGTGFNELLATASALTLNLSTAETVTGLNAIFNAVTNAAPEAVKLLKDAGIAYNVTTFKADGLTKTLQKLNEQYKKDENSLGKMIPSQEALRAVKALTDKTINLSIETQSKMNDELGTGKAVTDAYTASLDDLAIITKQALGVVKTLGEAFGEMFVEGADLKTMLKDFTEEVKGFKEQIKELDPETKKLYSWMIAAAIVIPPVTVAITGAAASIASLTVSATAALPVLLPLAAPIAAFTAVAVAGSVVGWKLAEAWGADEAAARKLSKAVGDMLREQKGIKKLEDNRIIEEELLWQKQQKRINDAFDLEKKNRKELSKLNKEEAEKRDFDSFLKDMTDNLDFVNTFLDVDSQVESKQQDKSTNAIEKGTIDALELESQSTDKIQNKQLKALEKIEANTSNSSNITVEVTD